MNKVFLIGKLGKDPALTFGKGTGTAVAKFSIAVDRNYKDESGNRQTDWINIVCFKKLAELVANNLTKGRLAAISGSIQTRNYEKEGRKVYITEVVADEVKFLDWPKDGGGSPRSGNSGTGGESDFFPIDDSSDIPF